MRYFYQTGWTVLFIFFGFAIYDAVPQNEKEHSVRVIHPGLSLTDSVDCTLIEVDSEEDQLHEFYMDVKTVVCGDAQCRIDDVRIYWDELGFYNRLFLPDGVALEKSEGKHFIKADYNKLDKILADKNSSLRDVYKEEVVGNESSDGIDGLTGATILLHTEDYVKGAVWTCYTLWHWTNGSIRSTIRDISGRRKSVDDLVQHLNEDGDNYKLFAVEQLTKKGNFQAYTVEAVVSAIQQSPNIIKAGIQYFENAPQDTYQSSILHLVRTLKAEERIKCMNAILKSKNHLPTAFYEELGQSVVRNGVYQEVNLFLDILDQNNNSSATMNGLLMQLISSDDFLKARRVYWYLQDQELSQAHNDILESFGAKNRHRL